MAFFHGARVTDAPSNPPPIQTINSSVIGLLCTGPNSPSAVAATASVGVVASNNALTFTAATPGAAGNGISISLTSPGTVSASLGITVNGTSIMVSLATDSSGNPSTTAATLITALAANTAASALVTATDTGGSTGAGILTAAFPFNLTGGADAPFPLNTPVLVAGNRQLAALMDPTGALAGTGPQALLDIFDQIGATVVVVRVAQGINSAATITNMIGGINSTTGAYTGMQCFLAAEHLLGVRPMILIAPGFTSSAGLLNAFIPIANQLRAHIVAEGPDTTDAAAVTYAQGFGSRRVFLVDPSLQKTSAINGSTISVTSSATIAGLIAATDNNLGFWWSPSNQLITNITGTDRPVDYVEADPNCRANYLNSQNVATIIRRNGFILWGNLTLSADPTFQFLSVSRTDDMIALSIQNIVNEWAVDRPITKTFFKDVADEVNAYLATLTNQGAIAGGTCYPDPTLNTPANIASGKVYFDYSWSPSYPAQDIEISSQIVETYLTTLATASNN